MLGLSLFLSNLGGCSSNLYGVEMSLRRKFVLLSEARFVGRPREEGGFAINDHV